MSEKPAPEVSDHEHVWRLGRFRDIDAILGCEVCGLPKGWPETFDRPVTGPGTEFDSPAFRAKQGDTTVRGEGEIARPGAASEAETIETSSAEAAPTVSLGMAAATAGRLAKAQKPKTKRNWEWQRKKNRRKMAKQARRKNR